MTTNIPGWTSDLELKILEDLASNVPENGSILEVGSFLGRSTSALFNGKKTSVSLDVVDPFYLSSIYSPTSNFLYIQGDLDMLKKAKQLALKTNSWRKSFEFCLGKNIVKKINVYNTSSQEFQVNKKYDLVFIDGDHTRDAVTHDLRKFLSDETLIVGDDFIEMFPGVAVSVASCRSKKSVVLPKNTKFYLILPSLKPTWIDVIQKYI